MNAATGESPTPPNVEMPSINALKALFVLIRESAYRIYNIEGEKWYGDDEPTDPEEAFSDLKELIIERIE